MLRKDKCSSEPRHARFVIVRNNPYQSYRFIVQTSKDPPSSPRPVFFERVSHSDNTAFFLRPPIPVRTQCPDENIASSIHRLFRDLLGFKPRVSGLWDVLYLPDDSKIPPRSEEHTSELQSRFDLVCRLLLEKKKTKTAP